MIVGYTTTPDPGKPVDGLVIRINSKGTPVWARLYATRGWLAPLTVADDLGSGFFVAGSTAGSGGAEPTFVMRLSPTGEPVWSRSYQAPRNNETQSLIVGYDDDFLVVGRLGDTMQGPKDGFAILFDRNGNVKADTVVKGKADTELMSAVKWSEGRYRLIGDTQGFGAAYIDILSLVWAPQATSGQFSPKEITIKTSEAPVVAVPLKLHVVSILVSSLETTTPSVPSP